MRGQALGQHGRRAAGALDAQMSVRMPRSSSQASNGPRIAPPSWRSVARRCQKSSLRAVTSAPATTSLWPFRYLVAECITRSAPSAIGRVSTGVATVLSTASRAPASCASSAAAAMSVIAQVGLAGVSIQTSLVLPGRSAAAIASRSLASTRSTTRPRSRPKVVSQRRRPQYITFGATTWSPGASAWNTAVAAAMPEAKVRQAGTALERREQRLGMVEGGVVGAGVGAPGAILVVGIADEGRGGVERRDHRPGGRVDPAHRLRGQGRRLCVGLAHAGEIAAAWTMPQAQCCAAVGLTNS